MKYLKIKNQGLINEKALYLLGASTKRGDNSKIGMFGSGNKYAMAYLLRNDYELIIYKGIEKINIEVIKEDLDGFEYDTIIINGRNTGITTEFGKDWELWQAIREIYCNAIDAGGDSMEYVNSIEPSDNETHFYIRTRPEVNNFFGKFDNYFATNKEVLFENKYGKIYKKHSDNACIYRKGIKCANINKNSIYDYDFPTIDIEENRLVKYSWKIEENIWKLIYSCTDKDIIKTVIMNQDQEMLEKSLSEWSSISSSYVSETFKEVLREMKICSRTMTGYLTEDEALKFTIVPHKIYTSIKGLLNDNNLGKCFKINNRGEMYREYELNELEQSTLNRALDFFKETEYNEPIQYEIIGGLFGNPDILGTINTEESKIVLSNYCLAKGVQTVVETIIEEYIHLKYKCGDETRAFQDAAITEMVCIAKRKVSYLL